MKKLLGIRTPDKLSPEKQGAQQRSASPTPRLPAAVTQSASSAANSVREARGAADETAPQCSLGLLVLRRVDEALALESAARSSRSKRSAPSSELWRRRLVRRATDTPGAGPLVAGRPSEGKPRTRTTRRSESRARRGRGAARKAEQRRQTGEAPPPPRARAPAAPTPVQAAARPTRTHGADQGRALRRRPRSRTSRRLSAASRARSAKL